MTRIRAGSYFQQKSDGSPLVLPDGKLDRAKLIALSRFDDVCLSAVPWAQGLDGEPRTDAIFALRRLNTRIRLWLYVPVDPWLPREWVSQRSDWSAYTLIHAELAAGNGFLYGTDGDWWHEMYRVNAGDADTMTRLGEVLAGMVCLRLFDGIFLDNLSPSIAWTNGSEGRTLDVARAGFGSLAEMDAARLANIEALIKKLHDTWPPLLVALNGTGPRPAGLDYDFREGLGSLITDNAAKQWMRSPGNHWLKLEEYGGDCATARTRLRSIAVSASGEAIISAGPNTDWPPCPTYPEQQ